MRVSNKEEQIDSVVLAIIETAAPSRVILFGSAAKGLSGPMSDLDFLVVVPRGRHRRSTALAIYRRLAAEGVAVDVVVVTEEDVDNHGDNPGLIIGTALAEGRELYAA